MDKFVEEQERATEDGGTAVDLTVTCPFTESKVLEHDQGNENNASEDIVAEHSLVDPMDYSSDDATVEGTMLNGTCVKSGDNGEDFNGGDNGGKHNAEIYGSDDDADLFDQFGVIPVEVVEAILEESFENDGAVAKEKDLTEAKQDKEGEKRDAEGKAKKKDKCCNVEKILDKRIWQGVWHYLVKWANITEGQYNWEPVSNLSNYKKMVQAFDKQWSKKKLKNDLKNKRPNKGYGKTASSGRGKGRPPARNSKVNSDEDYKPTSAKKPRRTLKN